MNKVRKSDIWPIPMHGRCSVEGRLVAATIVVTLTC